MKLSEIIAKYEPLGWKFKYETTHLDDFWSYQSPRLIQGHGFPWDIPHRENPEEVEIDEEKMLKDERHIYIYKTYNDKIANGLFAVKTDILRNLEILDEGKKEIPDEVKISFGLNLK